MEINIPEEVPEEPPEMGLSEIMAVAEEEKTELDKVLELLLDPKNIAHNTELTQNEILAFSVLATLARRHNLPVLQDFLAENLVLRVSKGRKGREEWVEIIAPKLQDHGEEEASAFDRIFGRR